MAGIHDDVIRQLEQSLQAPLQQPRLSVRIAGDVQIRTTDVADQERIAAEQEPRLAGAPTVVCDLLRVMRRRVPCQSAKKKVLLA